METELQVSRRRRTLNWVTQDVVSYRDKGMAEGGSGRTGGQPKIATLPFVFLFLLRSRPACLFYCSYIWIHFCGELLAADCVESCSQPSLS